MSARTNPQSDRGAGSLVSWSTALLILSVLTALNLFAPLAIPSPPSIPIAPYVERRAIIAHELNVDLKDVALTVEDSVNFHLDTSESAAQWRALQPSNKGFVTIPSSDSPNTTTTHRLAMFHALECLDTIRQGFQVRRADRETPVGMDVHLCLDYLRQTIQCRVDVQLEQVRSEYGGKSVQPFVTHSNCRNWRAVYEEMDRLEAHRMS